MFFEKPPPETTGPAVLENCQKLSTKCLVTESKNDQVIEKLKFDYTGPSNCVGSFSTVLSVNDFWKIKIFNCTINEMTGDGLSFKIWFWRQLKL